MSPDSVEPVIKKRKKISPIWILPFVALLLGVALYIKSVKDAGIQIVISFPQAQGLQVDKTKVMYKGLPLGIVRGVSIDKSVEKVNVSVNIVPEAEHFLVPETEFWIVKPKIAAGEISGLSTLLSGNYIAIQPGNTEQKKLEKLTLKYEGLENEPPLPEDAPGLHLFFLADDLGSLQRGSKIYHKRIEVGEVQGYELLDNGEVKIHGYINPEYKHLVKLGSRFWNASGVTISGDLSGFKFRTESVASLIYGGVSFYTPQRYKDGPQIQPNHEFKLYEGYDEAKDGIVITMVLKTADGIQEGQTKVIYRGGEVGVVKQITINREDPAHSIIAHILMDPRAEIVLRDTTKFWVVKPEVSLNGMRNIDTILSGQYITFALGDVALGSGEKQYHFIAEKDQPAKGLNIPGLHLELHSKDLGSLKQGSPILYKKMKVGIVNDLTLSPDGEKVSVKILIEPEYEQLVRSNSTFYNVSGVDARLDYRGIHVDAESVESLIAGGIAFITPKTGRRTTSVTDEESFQLFDSYQEAVENHADRKFIQPGLYLRIQADSLGSVTELTPILYKKIIIGEVYDYQLSHDKQSVIAMIRIEPEYQDLITSQSRFYSVSGIKIDAGLAGLKVEAESLTSIIKGGITFTTAEKHKNVVATPPQSDQLYPLYSSYKHAVEDLVAINLKLNSATGLSKGSEIRYQGITVGEISEIKFDQSLETIIATAEVQRKAMKLFREDSLIWRVKPALGLARTENLDTLLGQYLVVSPGKGVVSHTHKVLDQAPTNIASAHGLELTLSAHSLGSLKNGDPVLYRQIKIGEVVGYDLMHNAQGVEVRLVIYPHYVPLVRDNSRFWLASGIKVDFGLFSGLDIKTESVETILSGGITMATPDEPVLAPPAVKGAHFKLYAEAEEEWLEWNPEIQLYRH